ncbi:ribokinase [Pseudomonas sp. NPDC086278]|uniref:ribokinase n=1 Tax=Pseudomonas sp. NPDC086278 TaxID=3390646 RepID=UPI003CFF4218
MILVIGSINLDFLTSASRLPTPGETILGTAFEVFPGGKGANQALACRRAGSAVMLAGCIGADENGETAIQYLREAGVDLSLLKVTDAPTGTASIFVGESGENMIIVVPGSNGAFEETAAEQALETLRKDDVLLLQLEVPIHIVNSALVRAKEVGARSILNIAPYMEEASKAFTMADYVIMNESEMESLAATAELSATDNLEMLGKLRSNTNQVLVLTQGKDGAIALDGDKSFFAPAVKITPIDTVGAGDTFAGYFAAGLEQGNDINTAMSRAAVAGSLSCLTRGAQQGVPFARDLDIFVNGSDHH